MALARQAALALLAPLQALRRAVLVHLAVQVLRAVVLVAEAVMITAVRLTTRPETRFPTKVKFTAARQDKSTGAITVPQGSTQVFG